MNSIQLKANQLNIFVGGPIQYALASKDFDQSLKSLISSVIEQLSSNGCNIFSAHVAEKFGVDTHLFDPDKVTRRDFAWMQACDAFIVILPSAEDGQPYRSDGTHVELGWASALGKPVIVLTHEHCVKKFSHLVQGLGELTSVIIADMEKVLVSEAYLITLLYSLTDCYAESALPYVTQ